jgi:hypothetical protein
VPSPIPSPAIDIIYAAHTASCTFLLDSEGICRRIVVAPSGKRSASRTASRCVGAQYVASLDGSAAGGLVEMPRVGAAMLFARIEDNGRISLVRTSVVTSFESNAAEDPFAESSSGAVETSAPELDAPRVVLRNEEADDYYDASERTQRIQALRPDQIAAALGEKPEEPEDNHEMATAEYHAVEEQRIEESAAYRRTPPTLRAAPRDASLDDEDEYAKPTAVPAKPVSRAAPPRRSDVPAPQATARAYSLAPRPMPSSDVQLSRRHRDR